MKPGDKVRVRSNGARGTVTSVKRGITLDTGATYEEAELQVIKSKCCNKNPWCKNCPKGERE